MSLNRVEESAGLGAEDRYLQAFDRLVRGCPVVLPKGSRVTQNNVAREAGVSPSAMRKSRYPEVIQRIRQYLNAQDSLGTSASSQKRPNKKSRDRKAEAMESLKRQADADASRLISVLLENAKLRAKLDSLLKSIEEGKVVVMRSSRAPQGSNDRLD